MFYGSDELGGATIFTEGEKSNRKKEKSEEENEDVEEAEGDEEPEGDEELDKTEEQNPKIKIEEPTGIVLGLVSSDLNSERDIIKNKFLEKINILRAKRNAPPVKNISELKESAPPTKRQKRDKSTPRKRSDKKKEKKRKNRKKTYRKSPSEIPARKRIRSVIPGPFRKRKEWVQIRIRIRI